MPPRLQPDPEQQKRFLLSNPPPPVGTFELGLVLGGTVSAGTYTAGALDMLVQALDAWEANSGGKPPHTVRVVASGGSSGGAVCAALFGILTGRKFDRVSGSQEQLNNQAPADLNNWFWKLWVESFHADRLFDTDDLNDLIDDGALDNTQHVPALLNAGMFDDTGRALADFARMPPDQDRKWALGPFRVATTVDNLRGVPYVILGLPSDPNYSGNAFVQHDDFAWFAIPNKPEVRGAHPQQPGVDVDGDDHGQRRGDEFWLSRTPKPGVSHDFDYLVQYATASGAVPIGLRARPLDRPADHYLYRPIARALDPNDTDPANRIEWPIPDWNELPEVFHGDPYRFTGVDGGSLNNDPVRIVHDRLAGLVGVNPRGSWEANRALFMIDPLVDKPTTVDPVGQSLLAVVKAIVPNFVDAARYLTADLELFADEDVFSRFQLVPKRDVDGQIVVGKAALAGTDLFAVAGWCAREFRVHDYLLGRWNMLSYLQSELLLRGDNPLFNAWSFGERVDWSCDKNGKRMAITVQTRPSSYFLPIIPVSAEVAAAVISPCWPRGALDPDTLNEPVKTRVAAVLSRLQQDDLPGFFGFLLGTFGSDPIAGRVASSLVATLKAALDQRKLWPAETGPAVAPGAVAAAAPVHDGGI